MKKIILNGHEYVIEKNYKDSIDVEKIQELFTEYFDEFDYLLGDYSYNKLRLKGFYNSNNKKTKSYNDIKTYEKYLSDFCATECPYFLLKKVNKA